MLLTLFSVIAAATENYDDSKDDDPCAVIVEKMAEAVVVHNVFLQSMLAIFTRAKGHCCLPCGRSLIYILCVRRKT